MSCQRSILPSVDPSPIELFRGTQWPPCFAELRLRGTRAFSISLYFRGQHTLDIENAHSRLPDLIGFEWWWRWWWWGGGGRRPRKTMVRWWFMVMQVVMVMVYYHQANLKANKSREVLNLSEISSGCVENSRDSKGPTDSIIFFCAFVGDHIVQAKAAQQQWGICKGLGHLMLCIFVHSIHPAHVYFDVVKVSNGYKWFVQNIACKSVTSLFLPVPKQLHLQT